MSTSRLPGELSPMRLGAFQRAEIPSTTPLDQSRGTVYPTMYPFPGASYPSPALRPNVTFLPSRLSAPDSHNPGGISFLQGFGATFPRTGSVPPPQNPASPRNDASLLSRHYSFRNMQVAFQLPFRSRAATVEDQVVNSSSTQPQQGRNAQDSVTDLSVEEAPSRLVGEDDAKFGRTQQKSQPLPHKSPRHICASIPGSVCPGHGPTCIDELTAFIKTCPNGLSPMQTLHSFISVIVSSRSNAGQPLNTGTNVSLLSQQGSANCDGASSGPSTAASSSHSPTGSTSVLNDVTALPGPSSMNVVGSSAGKRRRSRDDPEDADTQGKGKRYCSRADQNPKKKRKTQKPAADEELICRLCDIFGTSCSRLSRKDSLKRHIWTFHPMFKMLTETKYRHYGVLEPRKINQEENLDRLIEFCIEIQSQARRRGEEPKDLDLTYLHPQVAASMIDP